MRDSMLMAVITSASLILVAMPANSETYVVAKTIPFAAKIGAAAEKLSECHLDTRLPEYVASAAGSDVEVFVSSESLDDVAGNVLMLEIVRADDRAGGIGFKRPARVAVRGELTENDELVGSFIVMRQTLKTAKFDGFKGTCAGLGRCLELLSRDIAGWLANPIMDAKLGDL